MWNPHVRGQDQEVDEPPERPLLEEVEDVPPLAEEATELPELEEVRLFTFLSPLLFVLLLLLLGTTGRPLGVPLLESAFVLLLLFALVPLLRSSRLLRWRLRPEETKRSLESEPIKLKARLLAPLDRAP